MTDVLSSIAQQFDELRTLELIAVVSAILYLVLAIRQNILCWAFAALSSSIYVYLMYAVHLYMETGLYVFYVAMAAYGAYSWKFAERSPAKMELAVRCWPLHWHAFAIIAIAFVSGLSGWLLTSLTDAAVPYIDSATTWASIWATFLVARKVLENWWYWLLIDFASFAIYWERELFFSAALFVIYLVMIPIGYHSWRRSMLSA